VTLYIGGLKYSSVIDKNLISAFVPFLPLERQHVKMCIEDDIKRKDPSTRKRLHLVDNIADELEYFPIDAKLFSSSGCKRVDEKFNLYRVARRRGEL